jgi:predicted nucleotidyltransferase component of viral defense system
MKEEALHLARETQDPTQRLNVLREYIQEFVLRSLHESEAFYCLSFVGGTALRLLHGLPRFSEDLDFSLEKATGYRLSQWTAKIERDLSFAGFKVTTSFNERKTVHTVWIIFSEILHELELSAIPGQKLSIKLEIDSNPPAGARLETRIIQRHLIFTLRHHDLPSLMAGKVHALLTRPFLKGRDWYDLVWYLTKRPIIKPNLTLLEKALEQTSPKLTRQAGQWRRELLNLVKLLDSDRLKRDAALFLERPQEAALLSAENMARLLDDDR